MGKITEVIVRPQNDYWASRWVMLAYEGVGKRQCLYTWHFHHFKKMAILDGKLHRPLEMSVRSAPKQVSKKGKPNA